MHASGRYGARVLDPATEVGALPLALHPVMTFTGTSLDLGRLQGICFGVTAPSALRPVAEALVLEMGGEPVWVEEAARPLYHAALAHGSNHLVTLVAQTLDLLGAAGVEDPARLVGPLLAASLDNTLRVGDVALTGPVAQIENYNSGLVLGVQIRAPPPGAQILQWTDNGTADHLWTLTAAELGADHVPYRDHRAAQ